MPNQYEKLVKQQARLKQKLNEKILNYGNLNIMKTAKHVKPVLAD